MKKENKQHKNNFFHKVKWKVFYNNSNFGMSFYNADRQG